MVDSTPARPIPVELSPSASARLRLNQRVMTVVRVSHPARLKPTDITMMMRKKAGNVVACGRAMKPRPNSAIPMWHTARGLKRSNSHPCTGLRTPANSCEPENALDIANLLHPNWCSMRRRYWPKVKPNAAPDRAWNNTAVATIHQP